MATDRSPPLNGNTRPLVWKSSPATPNTAVFRCSKRPWIVSPHYMSMKVLRCTPNNGVYVRDSTNLVQHAWGDKSWRYLRYKIGRANKRGRIHCPI